MSKQEKFLENIGASISTISSNTARITSTILVAIPKGAKLITYKSGDTALLIDGEIYKPDLNFYTRNFADDLDNDKTLSPKEIGCEVLNIIEQTIE